MANNTTYDYTKIIIKITIHIHQITVSIFKSLYTIGQDHLLTLFLVSRNPNFKRLHHFKLRPLLRNKAVCCVRPRLLGQNTLLKQKCTSWKYRPWKSLETENSQQNIENYTQNHRIITRNSTLHRNSHHNHEPLKFHMAHHFGRKSRPKSPQISQRTQSSTTSLCPPNPYISHMYRRQMRWFRRIYRL